VGLPALRPRIRYRSHLNPRIVVGHAVTWVAILHFMPHAAVV
jgi:hypothetical protein